MRNLTVFDGFANISNGTNLNIPISGFTTPPSGPVSFELGVIGLDGDRDSQGDQLQFNGAGAFVNVFDALHPTTNFFNSTISDNAVVTPFRIPNLNNTLGYDAGIFIPIIPHSITLGTILLPPYLKLPHHQRIFLLGPLPRP